MFEFFLCRLGLMRVGRAAPPEGVSRNDGGAAFSAIHHPLAIMHSSRAVPWIVGTLSGVVMASLTWLAATSPAARLALTVLAVPFIASALWPCASAWMRSTDERRNARVRRGLLVAIALCAFAATALAVIAILSGNGIARLPIEAVALILPNLLAVACVGAYLWSLRWWRQRDFGQATVAPATVAWRLLTFGWGAWLAIFVAGPDISRSWSDWVLYALRGISTGRMDEKAIAAAIIVAAIIIALSAVRMISGLVNRATVARIQLGVKGVEIPFTTDAVVIRAGSAGAVAATMGEALSRMGFEQQWLTVLQRARDELRKRRPDLVPDGGIVGNYACRASKLAKLHGRYIPNDSDWDGGLDKLFEYPRA